MRNRTRPTVKTTLVNRASLRHITAALWLLAVVRNFRTYDYLVISNDFHEIGVSDLNRPLSDVEMWSQPSIASPYQSKQLLSVSANTTFLWLVAVVRLLTRRSFTNLLSRLTFIYRLSRAAIDL